MKLNDIYIYMYNKYDIHIINNLLAISVAKFKS